MDPKMLSITEILNSLLAFDEQKRALQFHFALLWSMSRPYRISPLKLGAEVRGIDLKRTVSESVIPNIVEDVHKHRILVFRDQGRIEGKRQVEISKWFGDLDSEPFYKHPKSPSRDIFRVSNDENEGCRGVGRTGWHIDGSFRMKPYGFSIYHMPSVPHTGGETRFVGLREVVEGVSEERRRRWEGVWMVSDRRSGIIHPLLYLHPLTQLPTMCLHLGMTESFIMNRGKEGEKFTDSEETNEILKEIHSSIVSDDELLIYAHKWKEGDFIITDNLAVGHEAAPSSQDSPATSGLRILHRCTVAGIYKPSK